VWAFDPYLSDNEEKKLEKNYKNKADKSANGYGYDKYVEDKGAYLSAKAGISYKPVITTELGGFSGKTFCCASFSFLGDVLGGGVSLGGRKHLTEDIQIITGGVVGYWKSEDNNLFCGVVTKIVLGWFEIHNRFLIGDTVCSEIGVGYTFNSSKRK
jgi:nitrogenase subunit NifH